MSKPDSYVCGLITTQISMSKLSALLANSGYANELGSWKIRTKTKMCFSFAYVGNLTPEEPYEIEGDGYDVPLEEAVKECEELAKFLSKHGLEYGFTHIDGLEEDICEYTSNGF